jgi:hypothetical protein
METVYMETVIVSTLHFDCNLGRES